MKSSKVRFSENSETDTVEMTMEPELASKLYEDGGFLLIEDLPVGTEFGIDMNSWNTGTKFLGVKMIPAGLHFIFYSPASKEGNHAPRRGFFHNFIPGEVLVRKFDPKTEELHDDITVEEIKRYKSNLRNIDSNLGAYPYQSWKKWISLSNRITPTSLQRLQPKCGPTICSSTEVTNSEKVLGLPVEPSDPSSCINYSSISKKYPDGATPAEITKYSLDSSHQLEVFLAPHDNIDEVLVELQFSFLCFLVGQNYDSFCQWKHLVAMMCGCGEALLKYPQLFLNFISDMHFQMQEVPEDFFTDIVSCNNFLVTSLTDLFANIKENEDALTQLKTKAISFENHLSKKFGWSFNEEDDDEFAPVIVYD